MNNEQWIIFDCADITSYYNTRMGMGIITQSETDCLFVLFYVCLS